MTEYEELRADPTIRPPPKLEKDLSLLLPQTLLLSERELLLIPS
jgi:hypothetical protein